MTSTYSTGGGGFSFEYAVAATALASLLTGESFPGLGAGFHVTKVAFQAREYAVDDIVLTGRTEGGDTRTLAIAVRAHPGIVPSDERTVTLIGQMLSLVESRPLEFSEGRWRLGLVVSGAQTHVSQLEELCRYSRDRTSIDDFSDRLSTLNQPLRQRFKHFRRTVEAAGGDGDSLAKSWELLRSLYPVASRADASDALDHLAVAGVLRAALPRPDDLDALWSHLRNLAADFASHGAVVDQGVLRRRLIGLVEVDPSPRYRSAWDRLEVLDRRHRARRAGGLGVGDSTLLLPRQVEESSIVDLLTSGAASLVTGAPDVGKSTLALQASDRLRERGGFSLIVDLRDLPASTTGLEAYLGAQLEQVMANGPVAGTRTLIIDGAEAVLQGRRRLLVDVCRAALANAINVGVVTRSDARHAVREATQAALNGLDQPLTLQELSVEPLTDEEVDLIVQTFPALAAIGQSHRGRNLLARPGLVNLLLRHADAESITAGPMSEADVYGSTWTQWVRRGELTEGDGVSPYARERTLVKLAEIELGLGDISTIDADDAAFSSLRSDGLVDELDSATPWINPRFADDLVRDLAVAHLLLKQDFEPLNESTAPRWALRASRLACEILLNAAADDAEREESRQHLQTRFDQIAEEYGARWADLPWEAQITARQSPITLESAWHQLEDPNELRRLLRILAQRFMSPAGSAEEPSIVEPVVRLLVSHIEEINDALSYHEHGQVSDLIRGWMEGLVATDDCQDENPTRQSIRDALLNESLPMSEEERARQMVLLGPDTTDSVRESLLQIAESRPGSLGLAVESPFAARALGTTDPELLIRLAASYYIEEPDPSPGLFAYRGPWEDGIRRHRDRPSLIVRSDWYIGPFWILLNADPRAARAFINRMLDHAARVRIDRIGEIDAPGITVTLPNLGEQRFEGDSHTWAWYRGGTVGPYPCMSALMALERFADHLLGLGIGVGRIAEFLLEDANNAATAGLVVGFLVRHLDQVADELDPWLSSPTAWHLEFDRTVHEAGGLARRDDEGTPGAERRSFNLRDASTELVVRAVNQQDQPALDRLAGVADQLERAAESSAEASIGSATIRSWASALRVDRFRFVRAEDDRIGVTFEQPEDVVAALTPGHNDLQRGFESVRLMNRYRYDDPSAFDPEDIAVAQDLAADPPITGVYNPIDAPAAVAAATMRALCDRRADVRSEDAHWAFNILAGASISPTMHDFDYWETTFPDGADRSAARGLAALLLVLLRGERDDIEAAIDAERLVDAIGELTGSMFDEVRRAFADGLDDIWSQPSPLCTSPDRRCRHAAVLDAVLDATRDCRYGPWSQTGQRDMDPIEGDLIRVLPSVPADAIHVTRLTPALVVAAGAYRTSICVQAQASEALEVLLAAHRSGALKWAESGYSRNDEDRLAVAETLLQLSSRNHPALSDHLRAFLVSSEALATLLRDLQQVATYNPDARATLRLVWPAVMDLLLDEVDAGDLRAEGSRGSSEPLSIMMPAPQLSIVDSDPDGTLRAAAEGWPDASDLDLQIRRWIPMATGLPAAVDSLVSFLRTHSEDEQGELGLPWVLELVGADYQLVAGRTWHLVAWLEMLRAQELVSGEHNRAYNRLLDGLAEAGDRQAVQLQREDERHA